MNVDPSIVCQLMAYAGAFCAVWIGYQAAAKFPPLALPVSERTMRNIVREQPERLAVLIGFLFPVIAIIYGMPQLSSLTQKVAEVAKALVKLL